MQSSPILLDFSSAAFRHPRADALATTSGVSIPHPPPRKFHSTNFSLSSFSPSSTLLLVPSSHRYFSCRFGYDSPQFDSSEDDCYRDDEIEIDEDDYLVDCFTDGKTEDGVFIELKKLEKSSRRISSKIGMEASLDSVWSVLTDYEKLSDFIPGLVVSELVEKEGNRVRLFQVFDLKPVLRLYFNTSKFW